VGETVISGDVQEQRQHIATDSSVVVGLTILGLLIPITRPIHQLASASISIRKDKVDTLVALKLNSSLAADLHTRIDSGLEEADSRVTRLPNRVPVKVRTIRVLL